MIEAYIDEAIQGSAIPITQIAKESFISYNTLYKIRTGEQGITPDKTVSLAKALDKPELIRQHCQSCIIGQKFHLVYLNGNIRNQGHEILMKNQIEIKELLEIMPGMFEILFEKDTYTPDEKAYIDNAILEAIDVRHCIEMLEIWYAKRFGLDQLEMRVTEHNQKCFEKNYAKKEKDTVRGA